MPREPRARKHTRVTPQPAPRPTKPVLSEVDGGAKRKQPSKKRPQKTIGTNSAKTATIRESRIARGGEQISAEDRTFISTVEGILRSRFDGAVSEPTDETIREAAIEIFEKAVVSASDAGANTKQTSKITYPDGYGLYRGKKRDGSPIDFYDTWWRDAAGNHIAYRVDLRRLDPKLLQAMENHCRENSLDRNSLLPPPQKKRTEDRFRDPTLTDKERLTAAHSILQRNTQRRYQAKRRKRLRDASPE